MNAPSTKVRRRRVALMQRVALGPVTRAELDDLGHEAATTDLKYLRILGLVRMTARDYPEPPLWSMVGAE